jgi:hypothetical protein
VLDTARTDVKRYEFSRGEELWTIYEFNFCSKIFMHEENSTVNNSQVYINGRIFVLLYDTLRIALIRPTDLRLQHGLIQRFTYLRELQANII